MTVLKKRSKIKFGSKADTLSQIYSMSKEFYIPNFEVYTAGEWYNNYKVVINSVMKTFTHKLAVRSSAVIEDGAANSYAGAFDSVLHVDAKDPTEIKLAIEKVFDAYPVYDENNQVLIQEMVTDVEASGVVLTRCVDDGSPYYVISYDDETGSTDSVTSGNSIHKTVLVYRKVSPDYFDSKRVKAMLRLAQEVESLCGMMPLDIEFALDKKGTMHLLQARRISTVGGWHPDAEHRVARVIPFAERFVAQLSSRRNGFFGSYSVFANMPDWNPAELIGVIPTPLAASLFRFLITRRAWSEARALMGYRQLPQTELLVMIGGRAFIDVRASFNSFLPEGLSPAIGEKLIDAWLDRLSDNPSLHDKVEFEIAHTVMDFTFEETFEERYEGLLKKSEKEEFRNLLIDFTNKVTDLSDKGSLSKAIAKIDNLAEKQKNGLLGFSGEGTVALSSHISGILHECLHGGTIPFTIIARHAFIAETLLRSAVARGAITSDRVEEFKSSFSTVMGDLAKDTDAVTRGELDEETFHERYGHLRPGTFDILSPCYRDRPGLFDNSITVETHDKSSYFDATAKEKEAVNTLLLETGLTRLKAVDLFEYAKRAIQGREYAKFVFSKNLSEALEYIASWGEYHNLGREDLGYLSIEDIMDYSFSSTTKEPTSDLMQIVDQARIDHSLAKVFKLSYIVRGIKDIYVVPVHRSEPNFITQKQVEAPAKILHASSLDHDTIPNTIVCIENADPGYDWVFTKGIAGLITKYGGANSHMAIRCAELGLPAAIGCGEELFERLRSARVIDLNCSARTIRPLGNHVQ